MSLKKTTIKNKNLPKEAVDEIMEGLTSVLKHSQGKQTLRKSVVSIPGDPPVYTARKVKRLRKQLNMSQSLFARLLNVSKNTVCKWELDERHPSGPSARLLQIAEQHPEYLINGLDQEKVA